MLKFSISVLFLISISYSLSAQGKVTIEKLLQEEKISGAVWTLVQHDSIKVYSAGIKNMTTGEKLQSTDKIHVGSITKTVLALGVLRLATENKINLDAPIKNILPEVPIKNPWEKTNPITIRHLLDHTSGLSDLRLGHFFSSTAEPSTPLSEFYTHNPEVLKIHEKPGNLFSYSNMGYTLLGMVIEKVSNEPYERYLDENLLKPIGLHKSTFQFTSQEGAFKTEGLAMGHFENGSTSAALAIYLRPAGQFTTTANDMGVLIQFILNKGKIGAEFFIDSTHFEALGKPNYTIAYQHGLPNGYALGASLRDRHGVIGIAHWGNIIGYRAMLYVFPEAKKGFFISHNMDSETANYEVFNSLLIETLNIPKIKINNIPHHNTRGLENYEGFYVPVLTRIEPLELFNIIGSFIKIEMTENGMTIMPFMEKEIQLHHIGNGLFQSSGKVMPSHVLYEEEQLQLITSGIHTLKKISGFKIILAAISLTMGLCGIVFILISGVYQAIKHRMNIHKTPIIWILSGVIILIIAMILLASKGIVNIGDKNSGSVLLFSGSILLPVLSLCSFVAYLRNSRNALGNIGFWATLFVIQFAVLLLIYGLIPFATWN